MHEVAILVLVGSGNHVTIGKTDADVQKRVIPGQASLTLFLHRVCTGGVAVFTQAQGMRRRKLPHGVIQLAVDQDGMFRPGGSHPD